MRGYPDFNVPAFNAAEVRFRRAGFLVVNPVDMSAELGEGLPPDEYMRADIAAIACRCGGITLLPGWEASTGARCEAAIAVTLGLTFYDPATCQPVRPPEMVTICGGYERPPGVVESLDALVPEIRAFQTKTFPLATPSSIAEHLRREAIELAAHPTDGEEMADIFTLLIGSAAEAGVDLAAAVRRKLEKNKRRSWGAPDEHGVVQHVAEGAA
jgi:hypothetical protein